MSIARDQHNFICATCGTQFPESDSPPESCPICLDERQYLPPGGQRWTNLDQMRLTHRNSFERLEPNLLGVASAPAFAIGQRALLIQTPHGNVLWDCISLIDDATVDLIHGLGGLNAIAVSHPHFYSSVVEWSRAFGDVRVYLHAADREWVMRPDPVIRFWDGKAQKILDGLTLIHCGGHFEGSTALHWRDGADGLGVLFTSDTLTVAQDRRFISFMRSYPNLIPLNAAAVQGIAAAVAPYAYDRLYGGWWDTVIGSEAQAAVEASVRRYLAAIRA
jgi:glyoxylase-like metal-dependent hydrolase (beta-lactamase superfamily II)